MSTLLQVEGFWAGHVPNDMNDAIHPVDARNVRRNDIDGVIDSEADTDPGPSDSVGPQELAGVQQCGYSQIYAYGSRMLICGRYFARSMQIRCRAVRRHSKAPQVRDH